MKRLFETFLVVRFDQRIVLRLAAMGGAPEFAPMPRPVANGLSSGPQGEGRAPVFIVLERAVTNGKQSVQTKGLSRG